MSRIKILERIVRNYAKAKKMLDESDKACNSILKRIDGLPDTVARSVEKTLAVRG